MTTLHILNKTPMQQSACMLDCDKTFYGMTTRALLSTRIYNFDLFDKFWLSGQSFSYWHLKS
eukprot:4244689-Amphidinium_carterae.2